MLFLNTFSSFHRRSKGYRSPLHEWTSFCWIISERDKQKKRKKRAEKALRLDSLLDETREILNQPNRKRRNNFYWRESIKKRSAKSEERKKKKDKAKREEEKIMAMKFLVTFLLLISIGEIYSKTLLERIRDDSDLSQVSFCSRNFFSVFCRKKENRFSWGFKWVTKLDGKVLRHLSRKKWKMLASTAPKKFFFSVT